MFSEQDSILVCYGHIISLSPKNIPSSYLFSNGFLQNKITLKNSDSKNYSKCLFQILPAFLNLAKQNAINLNLDINDKYKNISDLKKKEILDDVSKKVMQEYKFNHETFEKLKNTPITFDSQIQLFHIASNKFLSGNLEKAELEKQNYKLELSEYPSEYSYFKFLPNFIFQKRPDNLIYYTDTVNLIISMQNFNRLGYVHLSGEIECLRANKEHFFQPNRNFKDFENRRFSCSKSSKIELNISFQVPTSMKINFFHSNLNEENILYYGDVVWLYYLEKNSSLALTDDRKDGKKLCFIKISDLEFSNHELIGNTHEMWVLENKDFLKGFTSKFCL